MGPAAAVGRHESDTWPRRGLPAAGRLVLLSACAAIVFVSPSQAEPALSTQAVRELPPEIVAALSSVRDFVPNVDQPGILDVFAFVKCSGKPPGHVEPPIQIDDWRDLLERPNDLRGRVIAVEGLVGRNKDPYTLASRPELGLFGQIELHRDGQPLACTIVCTHDTAEIPLNAAARFVGYFAMVRSYRGAGGREQFAALIVSQGAARITTHSPAVRGGQPHWEWLVGSIVLGLVVTVVLLRRSGRAVRHDVASLRATREAPVSLARELADWARENSEKPER